MVVIGLFDVGGKPRVAANEKLLDLARYVAAHEPFLACPRLYQ